MVPPVFATPEDFEELYARDPDPWQFATSDYERQKYAATLAALPPGRFSRAFEVGCSIGVLTRELATRCDSLLAVDVSATALRRAAQRCEGQPWVEFAEMTVPEQWPEGAFDLILFSEVLYYIGVPGTEASARRTRESLRPGGTVMLVNWHGPTDGACTGDAAAESFIERCRPHLAPTLQRRTEKYRLDVLR